MSTLPPVMSKPLSACMPSSPLTMLILPPFTVTVPCDVVSSSSGEDLSPSPSEVRLMLPPFTVTFPSEARALLAADTLRVNVSVLLSPIMTVADSPPFMPFLHPEPSAVRVPLPVMVAVEPLFTLIAAPSKSSEDSLAVSSASVSTLFPSICMTASAFLLTERGAVVLDVRVRPFRIMVTPVVPFLTVMLPWAHSPVTT